MARPVAADPEATRRRILSVATELFSRQGVASTPMRQIASAVELSQSTLHHHFGSKDGLYHACIEAMYRELALLEQRLFGSLTQAADLPEALAHGVREAWRFACEHRTAVRLMTRSVIELGETRHPERAAALYPFLEQGGALLSTLSPLPEEHLRFSLYTFTFAAVRLALVDTGELTRVLGLDADTPREALDAAAEAHLVTLAARLIGLAPR